METEIKWATRAATTTGASDRAAAPDYVWPDGGCSRIPFWVYTDEAIYRREQERIFRGPNWAYVALECEIPNPGDFKRSFVGDLPILPVSPLELRPEGQRHRPAIPSRLQGQRRHAGGLRSEPASCTAACGERA
jgi:hypothetical protein